MLCMLRWHCEISHTRAWQCSGAGALPSREDESWQLVPPLPGSALTLCQQHNRSQRRPRLAQLQEAQQVHALHENRRGGRDQS